MIQYEYTKIINADRLKQEVAAAGISTLSFICTSGTTAYLFFENELSSENKSTLDTVVNAHTSSTMEENLEKTVRDAMAFGKDLLINAAATNITLGIVQDNMTTSILATMAPIVTALQTGSLLEARRLAKAISADQYDAKYITGPRLLLFVNKIEDYLHITRSTAWY